jgi:hypothetical protein
VNEGCKLSVFSLLPSVQEKVRAGGAYFNRLQCRIFVSPLPSTGTEKDDDGRREGDGGRRRSVDSLTQEVGGGVRLAGFEGMLVRSAADPSGRNLVVFVENLRRGSTLAVVAADRLPRS